MAEDRPSLATDFRVSITSIEDPAQLAHARDMERLKELHRQKVELASVAAALLLTAIVLVGLGILCWHIPDADVRKAALVPVPAILTAWLGFLAGRASGKSS
jgi:hypothetical protein